MRSRRNLSRCRLLVLAVVAGLPAAAVAEERATQGVFLPAPGDDLALLQRVERARAEGNWDAVLDGLARFAEAFERPERNGVVASGGEMAWGLRRVVARLVSGLPPEQLVRYRVRVEPPLNGAWERSRESVSREERRRLRHVWIRDFPQTGLRLRALKEEVDQCVESGRWREARQACGELLEAAGPGAPSFEDRVRARMILAAAAAALGDSAGLQAETAALRGLVAEPGSDTLPAELSAQARAVLEAAPEDVVAARVQEGLASSRQTSALEPLVPGRGTLDGREPFRLGGILWERLASGSRLRSFVAERARTGISGDVPLPYHAVALGDRIACQHSDKLSLYDARAGREAWSRSIDPAEESPADVRCPLLTPEACFFVEGEKLHALRAEDGETLWTRAFRYDVASRSLRRTEGDTAPPEASPEPGPGEAPGEPAERAEDVQKDGGEPERGKRPRKPKVAAEGGTGKRRAQEPVRPACALSPPASLDGGLRRGVVVAVHVRSDQEVLHHIAALRPDGSESWTTYVGSAQGGDHLGLGWTPSVPLVHRGTVYHLTNTGILAALDAEDGAILWIAEYPRLTSRGKRGSIRHENRWQPNPVLPVGRELIAAPQDSPYLLGIDAGTGSVLWRLPRDGKTTLAGADERACFIVGREVAAVAHSGPARGRVLWRFPASQDPAATPAGAAPGEHGAFLPFGRPVLAPPALLVPAREALYCISTADGKVLSRTLWDFLGGAGNLLHVRSARAEGGPRSLLVVTSPEGVHVYGDFASETAALEALSPEKTESLLARAKLHLKNAELEASLKALKAWRESAPPAPLPNSALDHLHLDLSELVRQLVESGQAAAHAQDLLRYRVQLERTPRRKVEAAIDLAARLEAEGDPGGALSALHDALSFDNPATEYTAGNGLRVASAAYVRDRIRRLREATPSPELTFAGVDAAAREALRRAQSKLQTPAAFQEVVRLFPYTPAAEEAYLEAHRLFLDGQNHEQAIRALEGFLADHPRSRDAVRAKLLAAGLLHQSGRGREARALYQELLERHGTAPAAGAPGARNGETVGQYVEPILSDPGLSQGPGPEPPRLRFPVRMAWRSPADLQATRRTFLVPSGPTPAPLEDCFFTQSSEVVEMRRADTGLPVWRIHLEMIPGFEFDDIFGPGFRYPFARAGRRAFSARLVEAQGPLLVLHDERNIFAAVPQGGSVRWHVPSGAQSEVPDAKKPFGHLREKLRGVTITDAGVFASTTARKLRRYDLQGQLVWERELEEYAPAAFPPHLFQGLLWVHAQQPAGLRLHDAATGAPVDDEAARALVDELKEIPVKPPVELEGGRVLLPCAATLKLLDLGARRIAWTFRKRGQTIEEVFYSPEIPGECILVLNRINNWPALVAVDLADGREKWRHEKFPAARTTMGVFREENRLYVIHGQEQDQWKLLAIQVREGQDGAPIVEALWPNEIPLGHQTGPKQGRLVLGGDSLF
ncbi:MAG: PQQ-binding-like beta-propeller repeat protein, partial [Planctomycetes bacterium]|nr:PQQ-binding-like beta-propeller repeat protein [Planctomycetota bacterium]